MLSDDLHWLERAARLGLRGRGGAEPNPLVGCLIISAAGDVAGWGCHRRFGGPHAEIEALRRAGARAAGSTVYVTLEPCNHAGKTGPCTEALIAAAPRRVVVGRRDPNPEASGGIERLRAAAIETDVVESPPCDSLLAPFAHRVRTGLPWVIAKWAQTIDGRIATRTGESRWISGPESRRLVHRERGRVDAVLTGIGTVLADDPELTARGVRLRRVARRVVVDPELRIPPDARLLATLDRAPLTVAADASRIAAAPPEATALRKAGVELLPLPAERDGLSLEPLLRHLATGHGATNVLVEAGPGLLGRLVAQGLVCEAWVFVAPIILGDADATPPVRGLAVPVLADAPRLELVSHRQRGADAVLRYRRRGE